MNGNTLKRSVFIMDPKWQKFRKYSNNIINKILDEHNNKYDLLTILSKEYVITVNTIKKRIIIQKNFLSL